MKKVVIALTLVLFSLASFAQLPIDEKTSRVTFIEVVEASDLTAKELCDIAKEWISDKGWKVTEEVENGKIIYEAHMDMYYPCVENDVSKPDQGTVSFSYSLFFKDGRMRYIATDFKHTSKSRKNGDGGELESKTSACGAVKMSAKGWVTIKKKTKEMMDDMNEALKQKVKEVQNDPARNDDW